MNMPTTYIEEFETSLLTLFSRVPGFMEGKADSALSNPCFMTSPSDFTTFEFPISNYFNFQNLLEVVAIKRKNCRDGSRHYIYMKSLWREGSRNGFVAKSEPRQTFFWLLPPIGSRTWH